MALTPSASGTATQLINNITATPSKIPNGQGQRFPGGDVKPTPISLAAQAGNSDWIVLIGILIVAIIVVPILLKHNEWRRN